jgi:hypothetical protein
MQAQLPSRRLTLADLQVGDVLMFQKPTAGWLTPARYPKTEKTPREISLCLHEVISLLDQCAYTHVAMVVDTTPTTGPRIAGSDQDGVVTKYLRDFDWEYGGAPTLVLRPRGSDRAIAQRAATKAKSIADKGHPYPNDQLITATKLVALRSRPVTVRSSRFVQRIIRDAERLTYDITAYLDLSAKRVFGRAERNTWMCAAFVSHCYVGAGMDLAQETRDDLGVITVPACLKDAKIGHALAPMKAVLAEFEAPGGPVSLELNRLALALRLVTLLADRIALPRRWRVRLVTQFATAYDLEHSDQFQHIGQISTH